MVQAFRFDAGPHAYVSLETGAVLPHITGMLLRTGWVDDTWFTEESSARGTAVHALTAEYDLDALDVARCVSPWRGYLLGYVAAMGVVPHRWHAIEEPVVHPIRLFGGRPDRVGLAYELHTILEVKSAVAAKSHAIQTALQAILVSGTGGLPAEHYQRLTLYLKPNGKFSLVRHQDRRDFAEAQRIIRVCCG